ncbi:hypothetical protein CHS0354_031162 [Potamilus streckersoni]|uniref:Uncharacterized protein n=1 Tax=Potamilus streckersoni TaxID=2493646 RepID=A0AAE0TLD9_9BIVA|nr:hypothetical protein CHS0354_031162 [Potamilus streckersoni]
MIFQGNIRRSGWRSIMLVSPRSLKKVKEIGKLIGGQSGISILVSWETRLKDAITSIKKQYEEQLKAIQILYERE